MGAPPLLTLRGITKSFPGVLANDRVDLDVHGGEVHAVVGENGAGKSTLMKILYGFSRPDAGEIRLDGRPIQLDTPQDARRCRIGMVFQEMVQVPALTVAENISLFLPDLPAVIDSLFEVFANLRRDGYAVVFITHKLREVLACADRITVMRRGVVAGALTRAQGTEAALVSLMFGVPVAEPASRATMAGRPAAAPILQLERVSVPAVGHGAGLAE